MKAQPWCVMLRGRRIDIVFFDCDMDAEQVKRSLVEHDGYDADIRVRRYGKAVKS